MDTWEFTYVSLGVGEVHNDADGHAAVDKRMEEIARLGDAGWEPVGEIHFKFKNSYNSYDTSMRRLMFKRRAQ